MEDKYILYDSDLSVVLSIGDKYSLEKRKNLLLEMQESEYNLAKEKFHFDIIDIKAILDEYNISVSSISQFFEIYKKYSCFLAMFIKKAKMNKSKKEIIEFLNRYDIEVINNAL